MILVHFIVYMLSTIFTWAFIYPKVQIEEPGYYMYFNVLVYLHMIRNSIRILTVYCNNTNIQSNKISIHLVMSWGVVYRWNRFVFGWIFPQLKFIFPIASFKLKMNLCLFSSGTISSIDFISYYFCTLYFHLIQLKLNTIYLLDNWSVKAKRRRTTGTGRRRFLKDVHRRFKNGFREGGKIPKPIKSST